MASERHLRIARRDGRVIERAWMAVSPEMAMLRKLQRELNYFLYSTELSYGLALTGNDSRLANGDASVSQALADVYASAWYPSNQGEIKYKVDTSTFLEQLARNARYVSRAVVVQWCSYFEEYLEKRVRRYIHPKQKWGPLTKSLSCDQLRRAGIPIRISTVLRADFCREIRHLIVHGSPHLPDSYDNPEVVRWRDKRVTDLEEGPWIDRASRTDETCSEPVMDALHYVLGQAINHMKATKQEGRRENLEHFYTLFSLTNLDSLAVEIEEALVPHGELPEGRISRKAEAIRRKDLIVQHTAGAG
jgi:hypothetical protein